MAIPRGLIRKLSGDNEVYTNGLSLYNTPFSFKITPTDFIGFYQASAEFETDACSTHLEIDNEHEWIESCHCSCSLFSENGQICKHIVALLLKIENDFFSDVYGQNELFSQSALSTDANCLALLEQRANVLKNRARQRASFEKALLYPVVTIKDAAVRISIKAGCGRAYIVKDLSQFYHSLLNRVLTVCGRNEEFIYAPENFYDEGLARFILAYYPLCKEEDSSKTMLLTPEALDRFLNMYADEKLTADLGIVHLETDLPEFTLCIKSAEKFYRMSLNRRNFTILEGQNQIYIKENDVIYLCGTTFSDACGSLLRCFIEKEHNPIIHKDDMATFYSMMIKPATRFIKMECNERSFMPGPLKTKIYLDVQGKAVTARTEFYYDNNMYYAFSTDRDLKTVWDVEGEALIENLIKTYFSELDKAPGTAKFIKDEEKLFTLVYEGIPALSKHAVLYIGAELKNVRIKPFPSTRIGVRAESGLLNLDISAGNLSIKSLAAALSAYRQKKKYIRLQDNSYLLLETETMEQLNRLAIGTGFSASDLKKQGVQLPAYRAMYLDSIRDANIVKDKSFTDLINAFTNPQQTDFPLPTSLKNVLRDYQVFGFSWLCALTACNFGGILADDMGLGKTLQILSLLSAYKNKKNHVKALVVCPASLILNWEHEIKLFTPELKALCLMGTATERFKLLQTQQKYDVLITSYDLLKRDIHHYQTLSFDFEIIDEAQYIKNHNTQNARAVKAIVSKHRFALTGTPIENSIAELWSVFDFLLPGYLFRYARFRQRFEIPVVRDGDMSVLRELKKMTAPFILRRIKQDVLKELPEKTETVLYTHLAQEQNKLYFANLALMHKELNDKLLNAETGQNSMIVLAMLMRLRQICCDPSLLYENYKEKSAKFELCMNLVESSVASGHKILIFSQFTGILAALGRELKQMGFSYYLIEGATKKEERQAQIDAFNQDDTPVFLISLKAGGTGLNLTGADMVIHYDPWWNLSAQNQATDRAYRIGQKNKVSVYKLIAKDTIEEKILALAAKKQQLANKVLPDESTLISHMSKEEILDLFK